ncbi:porin family protein [Ferrimonas pelagia]|uniref:Outer membrane protein beta-barrel domain-containing protein n=1 Tax=Ferrimonas pelagia TaxID=1177826 RepID=A0ABP9EZ44_9GAMM
MRRILMLLPLIWLGHAHANWELDQSWTGHWYAGAQLGYSRVKGETGTANPASLHILGGYQFNDHIGVESRIGSGLNDDSFSEGLTVQLDTYYGLYLTGRLAMSDWVQLYALAGILNISMEFNDRPLDPAQFGQVRNDNATDFSYGAGLQLYATEQMSMTFEVIRWIDKGRFDVSGLNIGIRYDF